MNGQAPGASPSPLSLGKGKRKEGGQPHPDHFLATAKRLVLENYNAHHESAPLKTADVHILWSSRTESGWTVRIASRVAEGLNWLVSFDIHTKTARIEIWKKLLNVNVSLEESP